MEIQAKHCHGRFIQTLEDPPTLLFKDLHMFCLEFIEKSKSN